MFSGRHLLLLGVIACVGLLSVRDGQQQIQLGYRLGALEKQLREAKDDIELCQIKHRALQSPKAVMDRTLALKLPLEPIAPPPVVMPVLLERPTTHSLGSPQGARLRAERPSRNGPAQRVGATLTPLLAERRRTR